MWMFVRRSYAGCRQRLWRQKFSPKQTERPVDVLFFYIDFHISLNNVCDEYDIYGAPLGSAFTQLKLFTCSFLSWFILTTGTVNLTSHTSSRDECKELRWNCCLSVAIFRSHISKTTRPKFTKFPVTVPVARFSSELEETSFEENNVSF